MDVKAARDRNGWSRKQLAELVSLSQYRIWQFEVQGAAPTDAEVIALERAFGATREDVVASNGATAPTVNDEPSSRQLAEARIVRDTPAGATRSTTWRGVRYGDTVKVRGEQGGFMFQFHHIDDQQEYVQVVNARNRGTRAFTVERIRDRNGRALKQ